MSIWPGEGIKEGENIFSFARRLELEVIKSLTQLAQACQRDPRLKAVKALGGYSHLAKIAPRLGFDVFPIEDEAARNSATIMSYGQALMATKGNKLWRETEKNFSPAQEALISITELVRRFSPQSQK